MTMLSEQFVYARWTGKTTHRLGARGAGATPADSFFAVLPGIADMHRTVAEAHRARAAVARSPLPQVRRMTVDIDRSLRVLAADIKASEARIAQSADDIIKAKIRSSRKRPPTTGLMERSIRSRPLHATLFPVLSVGIGDLAHLDRPMGRLRYYWRTQEFGSHHNVGRSIPGRFHPGGAAPDPAQSRSHPFFRVESGNPEAPWMTISNPIEERAFLREGAWEAGLIWQREAQRIISTASRDARRIQALIVAHSSPLVRTAGRRP